VPSLIFTRIAVIRRTGERKIRAEAEKITSKNLLKMYCIHRVYVSFYSRQIKRLFWKRTQIFIIYFITTKEFFQRLIWLAMSFVVLFGCSGTNNCIYREAAVSSFFPLDFENWLYYNRDTMVYRKQNR